MLTHTYSAICGSLFLSHHPSQWQRLWESIVKDVEKSWGVDCFLLTHLPWPRWVFWEKSKPPLPQPHLHLWRIWTALAFGPVWGTKCLNNLMGPLRHWRHLSSPLGAPPPPDSRQGEGVYEGNCKNIHLNSKGPQSKWAPLSLSGRLFQLCSDKLCLGNICCCKKNKVCTDLGTYGRHGFKILLLRLCLSFYLLNLKVILSIYWVPPHRLPLDWRRQSRY